MLPLKSIYITSPYGWRIHPVLKVRKFHAGVDLRASYTSVYSVAPGIVEYAKWMGAYGNAIKINHGAFTSFYAHLKAMYVKAGDTVTEGQAIALSGNTGTLTTAPHLHFGIYVEESVDPLKYLEDLSMEEIRVIVQGIEIPAVLYKGRTYVSIRPYASIHGEEVGWNEITKTATVTGGKLAEIIKIVEGVK